MTEHAQANLSLSREEIELIKLAMECLYSELPEYESVMKKLGAMQRAIMRGDTPQPPQERSGDE